MSIWEQPTMYSKGIYRLTGKSKDGVNVVISQTKYFNPSDASIEEFEKYIVYTMENSVRHMDSKKSTQHIFVFDLSGWQLTKHGGPKPTKVTRALVGLNQSHYPERLLKAVIINHPWVFKGFWNLLYPFIGELSCFFLQLRPRS